MTDEGRRLLLSGARWHSRNPRPRNRTTFRPATRGWPSGTSSSGVLLYGLIGWLLDRWLGTSFLVVVGILVGITLGMLMTWWRFRAPRPPDTTRDRPPTTPAPPDVDDAVRTTQETR